MEMEKCVHKINGMRGKFLRNAMKNEVYQYER